MAYGVKYQFSIEATNGNEVDIFLLQRDYSGQKHIRALGRAPILKRERNGCILGTSLEIFAECRVDGEFAELYTSDAYEYKVEVYKRQILQWTGFVSPELYAEPDIAPPYDVQIIATDGLGELKNYDFAAYVRPKSYQAYIESMLEHTGLALPVEIVSDLQYYDEGWSDANGLESIVADLSHKAGENCYDVLQAMLTSVNACITQQDGIWAVIRESDLYSWRDTVGYEEFGSMNSCDWWPVGNLNADIIPAKKYLSLTSENHYKPTVLRNSAMTSDEGWAKEYNAAYDETEKAYILPDGGSNIRQTINFFTEVGYRLFLHISARNVGTAAESQKLGVMIKINGRMYQAGDEFWLKEIADYEGRYAWSNTEGYLEFELPEPSDSETRADASDIEVVIPLYKYDSRSYAYATSLEVTIFNISGVHDIYLYECSLQQYEQPHGHKIEAVIANGARESMSDIELALNDGTYAQPAAEIFRNALPIAYHSEAIIQKWKTPAAGEGSYLSVMAKDYAMQVALPRMRYRGKLNVPSMAIPVVPLLFFRDGTYYFLNTYSYDLLNDELEVELISIPNANVAIESETITEIASPGSASGTGVGGSGVAGGGSGSSTLAGLTDVSITSPAESQILVYDSATGRWVNKTISLGGGGEAYTLPLASYSERGGIKIGFNESWSVGNYYDVPLELSNEAAYIRLTPSIFRNVLGYTPFDSAAFTKASIKNALGIADWALASSKPSYTWTEIGSRPTALSAFTNDLGLGSLAYKSSLVASDIPSLPWSKITSGKPTTLSGYGITDAILYEKAIDLSSAYRSMGYGHASKGWRISGPAVVFGDLSYNLAMQCAIANADYVSLYLRMRYNGEDKGWDRVVTEGLLSRGAISFDTSAYKCLGDIVIHRNSESGDTFLNYGVANTDKANLRVFGYNISFYAGEASAYNTYLSLYAGGTAQFFVPLTIAANLTVTGDITASGNSSSKNFPQGKVFSQDPTSAFITTMFDADAVGDAIYRMRLVKTGGTGFDGICPPYSSMLVVKSTDTHGFISFGYNDYGRYHCYIGGGNADKINWSGILFHNNMSLLPKTDIAYDLGELSYRWKGVYAYNLYASTLYGPRPSGGSYNQYRMTYSEGSLYLQAGSNDGATTAGIVTISGINIAALTEFRVFAKYSLFTGDTQVNGTSRFVSLATFDKGIKIGDATITWDSAAGMLKVDKGIYSEGAITAKKKA